jgi:hypothetical protein
MNEYNCIYWYILTDFEQKQGKIESLLCDVKSIKEKNR